MTRDSQKRLQGGNQSLSVLSGNVEGADLKNNSQSTTHIDPKAGTGGKLCVLA